MQKLKLNLLQVYRLHCSAGHFGPHEKPELKIVSQLCFVDPEVVTINNIRKKKVPYLNNNYNLPKEFNSKNGFRIFICIYYLLAL